MAHAARPTRCAPDVAVARPFVAVVPGECDYAQRATGGHARCVDGAYPTENYVGPISIVLGCFLLGPFLCPLVFLCPVRLRDTWRDATDPTEARARSARARARRRATNEPR